VNKMESEFLCSVYLPLHKFLGDLPLALSYIYEVKQIVKVAEMPIFVKNAFHS